jgi:hypothetical protein
MCKLAICSAPVTPRSAWVPSVSSGDATQEEGAPDTLRSPVSADVSGERPIVVTMHDSGPTLGDIDRMLDAIQAEAQCCDACGSDGWGHLHCLRCVSFGCRGYVVFHGSLARSLARTRRARYGWNELALQETTIAHMTRALEVTP